MLAPSFEKMLVADKLQDGYRIQLWGINNGDGKPDLVTSGLALGEVYWYENPTWQRRLIGTLPKPVAWMLPISMAMAIPTSSSAQDPGSCMYHCKPERR